MGIGGMKVVVFLIAFIVVRVSGGCEPNSIACPKKNKCIKTTWICDNDADCDDRSDEAYCSQDQPISCPVEKFQCPNGNCISRISFCDGINNCGDNADEFYCDLEYETRCPYNWIRCNDGRRCIQGNWKCDGFKNCFDGSDEYGCARPSPLRPSTLKREAVGEILNGVSNVQLSHARNKNIGWLLRQRRSDFSTKKWGHELPRIATALYLADERFFAPGNKTGEEMGYELTIQLLDKLSGNKTMRSQELALFVQAMLVTCTNPKSFFGHNLVSELRRRVDESNYTNPFEVLVLCNAGDTMTSRDIERITSAFDSQHRPFWTDIQAIATMALQCLSTSPNVMVDERMVKDMQDELKKHQYRNGTVDNPITTALVVQALLSKDSYKEYFNMSSAIGVLIRNQKSDGSWGSIRNSYYVLPALYNKSLLNVSSKHCYQRQETEEESLQKLQDARGDKFVVQYSVWIGNDVDLGRTWRVLMQSSRNISFYDVIETVRKLDSKHNVTYNVIDNKPYVSSLFGKEDDPELGVYWFTYVRSLLLTEGPKLIEQSPVDVKVLPRQELILWYKPGRWSGSQEEEA